MVDALLSPLPRQPRRARSGITLLRSLGCLVFTLSACTFIVPSEGYFDGASHGAGASGAAGTEAPTSEAGSSGALEAGAVSDGGEGGMSGTFGDAGASLGGNTSGGATSSSGGTNSSNGGDCDLAPTTMQTEACGACGTRMRTLTLDDTCSYLTGPWSACLAEGECSAGQVDTGTQACGACNTGKQTRTRTCDASTCTWKAWGAWSTCGGVIAACTPGQTTACTNKDSCGQRVCSSSCTWGACTPKVSGGCLRIGPGHTDEGSNFRCCSANHWQFCLSDCHWSSTCDACSNGSPDYCDCH